MDIDSSNTLEAKEITVQLISLGIIPDENYIEKGLLLSLGLNDLNDVHLTKLEFYRLYKVGKRTDRIVGILDKWTK